MNCTRGEIHHSKNSSRIIGNTVGLMYFNVRSRESSSSSKHNKVCLEFFLLRWEEGGVTKVFFFNFFFVDMKIYFFKFQWLFQKMEPDSTFCWKIETLLVELLFSPLSLVFPFLYITTWTHDWFDECARIRVKCTLRMRLRSQQHFHSILCLPCIRRVCVYVSRALCANTSNLLFLFGWFWLIE